MSSRPALAARQVIFLSAQATPEPCRWVRIGGMVVGSNLAAPIVSLCAAAGQGVVDPVSDHAPKNFDAVTFDGRAYVAAADRLVVCRYKDRHYQVEIESLGVFRIDPDQQRVTHHADHAKVDPELLWQVFLGPCLPLLLAEENRYFLHASAAGNTGLTAFAGPSGVGKSTIARALLRAGNRRAADDLLPMQVNQDTIHVGSPFPQLKLDDLGANAVSEPKLDRLLVLRPDVDAAVPALRSLSPSEAMLAVTANTIALKLFGQRHLRQHLKFSRLFAERVQCLEMRYRQQPSQLPAMLAAIGQL